MFTLGMDLIQSCVENTDLVGLQQVIKQMTGVLIEEILEAERDEFLGYHRYQRKDEKNGNSRNGYSQERVRSSFALLRYLRSLRLISLTL